MRCVRTLCSLVGAGVLTVGLTAFPATAQAQTPVLCSESSLVDAIATANAAGGDTLLLPFCTYRLTSAHGRGPAGPVGLPPITSPITLLGMGSTITRDPSAPAFRVMEVEGAANVPAIKGQLSMVGVTVSGGSAVSPYPGGGISNFYVNAPVLAALAPVSGPLSGGNTVTLTGTHLVEATAVRFANTAATSFTVVSDTRITAVAPAGPAGPVEVTVSTAGGTRNAVSYAYVPAPALAALSPGQGPASGGNSVTLTGTGLGPTTRVLFGTTPATFTVVSDTHVVAEAPPGAVGPVDVTVVTPGGTSAPAGYTRVGPPAV